MVTENEPSEKITALFVAGRANGLIRDPVGTVVGANRHGRRLASDQGDRHQFGCVGLRGGNAALASLLTALASHGLITNSTT